MKSKHTRRCAREGAEEGQESLDSKVHQWTAQARKGRRCHKRIDLFCQFELEQTQTQITTQIKDLRDCSGMGESSSGSPARLRYNPLFCGRIVFIELYSQSTEGRATSFVCLRCFPYFSTYQPSNSGPSGPVSNDTGAALRAEVGTRILQNQGS
jgi:CRISPR/Cas system-associated protein Cas10 (large subunit of type III CRISPR-Cas system)